MNSGAVKSGKKYHCTPLQSLDAVRQFCYSSLFITISPSEWPFPQVCFHLTHVMLLGIFDCSEAIRLQNVFVFS